MNVIEYCTEEVQRQGHSVETLDGIQRVNWMLQAWVCAINRYHCKPTLDDAIAIGRTVEPAKNVNGLRTCFVRVGNSIPCSPSEVQGRLYRLFSMRDDMTPIEFYKEFETIHPFADGNGRTGKVLLNWLNGTLLNPIFPPSDLFGSPIRNP